MATSGETNFSLNRDEIIKAALRKTGKFAAGETPEPEDITDAAQALNGMVKEWQEDGIGLWLNQEVVLFLDDSTQRYALGGTAKCVPSESIVATEVATAAETGDTTLVLDSTVGMTAADVIGVLQDDNTIHWTTIDSVTNTTTLELTAVLTDDVAVDRAVYTYDSDDLIARPLELVEARLRIWSNDDSDIPLEIISRDEYMSLSNKAGQGSISQVYFDRQRTDANLYVWPVTNTEANRIYGTIRRTVENFDAVADDADFPAECTLALIWNLADEIEVEYGTDQVTAAKIERKAAYYKKQLEAFDVNDASVRFVFNSRRR